MKAHRAVSEWRSPHAGEAWRYVACAGQGTDPGYQVSASGNFSNTLNVNDVFCSAIGQ